MSWTKLSDDYGDDCWTLSDAAFRTHTEGLCWSNRKLLDLQLPKVDVPRFTKHPEAATELVASGYWRDLGDHYLIVHHGQYQRARDKVIKQQEVNRANRSKRGKATPASREQFNESSNERSNDSLNDSQYERDRTGRAITEAGTSAAITCRVCGFTITAPTEAELAHSSHEMCDAA